MASDARWFTIVNPKAGGGRCGKRAPAALERLRAAGLKLDVRETTRAGEAIDLARDAYAAGQRRFLGVGGDGTGYEIVNGVVPLATELGDAAGDAERPKIGLLPLGTGNSFLRDFGISRAEHALAALERGETRRIDVVRAEHAAGVIHYVNLLSVGFTAEAGDLTNRRFKGLGPAGYVAATLITAARLQFPVFPLRLDDDAALDRRPAVLISFSNSKFTAGTMKMAPRADASDGELDVIRIGKLGKLRFFGSFPSIFKGEHVLRAEVEQRRAKRVELALEGPVDVMVDGEIARLQLERLEVLPGAVEVVL